jgi:hypothetical protein
MHLVKAVLCVQCHSGLIPLRSNWRQLHRTFLLNPKCCTAKPLQWLAHDAVLISHAIKVCILIWV